MPVPAASTARFAPAPRAGAGPASLVAERAGFVLELVVVDEPLREPDAVRLVGVDLRRGEDHLLGLARTDQTRQALRAAEVGNDPVPELEQTEAGAVRDDPDVARQRELEPTTQREAADRGDRSRTAPPRARSAPLARAMIPATTGSGSGGVGSSAASPAMPPPPPANTDVSRPLENARPSPMTINARMSPGSARSDAPRWRNSRHMSKVIALSLSGRFNTRRATWPSSPAPRSKRIDSYSAAFATLATLLAGRHHYWLAATGAAWIRTMSTG